VRDLAKISKPAEPVSEETLSDVGLLRNFGNLWKYKFSINQTNFFTANSKEDAVERATEAHRKAPKEKLLTREQRDENADRDSHEETHRQYGHLTKEEVEEKISKLDADVAVFQKSACREFDGNGGRRSSAAVSAEGARGAAEEKRRLERYHEERFGQGVP